MSSRLLCTGDMLICRDAVGGCDLPEYCDGEGACPADVYAEAGTVCRKALNTCDPVEECNGLITCPADVTFDDARCTEWCGYSQGFWKENVLKYVTEKPNGRQVCNQFFLNTYPSDALSTCGATPDCNGWACINNAFQEKDQLTSQMMALKLSMQYHEVEQPNNFVINCSEIKCAGSIPACNPASGDEYNGGYPLMTDVYGDLLSNPSASVCECPNTYNDAQCSANVIFPDCAPGSKTGPTTDCTIPISGNGNNGNKK